METKSLIDYQQTLDKPIAISLLPNVEKTQTKGKFQRFQSQLNMSGMPLD